MTTSLPLTLPVPVVVAAPVHARADWTESKAPNKDEALAEVVDDMMAPIAGEPLVDAPVICGEIKYTCPWPAEDERAGDVVVNEPSVLH